MYILSESSFRASTNGGREGDILRFRDELSGEWVEVLPFSKRKSVRRADILMSILRLDVCWQV